MDLVGHPWSCSAQREKCHLAVATYSDPYHLPPSEADLTRHEPLPQRLGYLFPVLLKWPGSCSVPAGLPTSTHSPICRFAYLRLWPCVFGRILFLIHFDDRAVTKLLALACSKPQAASICQLIPPGSSLRPLRVLRVNPSTHFEQRPLMSVTLATNTH